MRPAGYKHTDETKRKIGIAHAGKVITLEQRERIRAKLLGRRLSAETRAKMSASRRGRVFSEAHKLALSGERNHDWKGDTATYSAKHMWVRRHFGVPNRCAFEDDSCNGRIEWSNISRRYLRVRDDWQELCRSHHVRFDRRKV